VTDAEFEKYFKVRATELGKRAAEAGYTIQNFIVSKKLPNPSGKLEDLDVKTLNISSGNQIDLFFQLRNVLEHLVEEISDTIIADALSSFAETGAIPKPHPDLERRIKVMLDVVEQSKHRQGAFHPKDN